MGEFIIKFAISVLMIVVAFNPESLISF